MRAPVQDPECSAAIRCAMRSGRLRPGSEPDRHDVLNRDFSSVSPSRFPAGRLFQDAKGLVGERPVGTLEHLNLCKSSLRVDHERDDCLPRQRTFVSQSDGRFFETAVDPSFEIADIAPAKAGRGVAMFEADGVPEDHSPCIGPFRGSRSLPERVSCCGGQQQQRRAELSQRDHGLAWKTALSSPLERISSIGPSIS